MCGCAEYPINEFYCSKTAPSPVDDTLDAFITNVKGKVSDGLQ